MSSLLDTLSHHQYLGLLDLRKNQLDDEFASELSRVLRENDVLYKADISGNPISNRGGQMLLETVLQHNMSLESFGNLKECAFIGLSLVQEMLTTLRNNHPSTSGHANNTSGYVLLDPIQFTNKVVNDDSNFKIWNI